MIDASIRLLNQSARFRFFWRRMRLHIPPGALVLDVGSGENPHGRADLLCDRYPTSWHHRTAPLFIDRPMVVGDVERLPFRDGAFDYVICSHMLDHADRPEQALNELNRVAHAGYVETISTLSEKLGGALLHRWTFDVENGVLLVKGKPRPMFDEELYFTFHRLWQQNAPFMFFYWQNLRLLHTRLEWSGKIPFRIIETKSDVDWPPEDQTLPEYAALTSLLTSRTPVKWWVKNLLYRLAGQWRPRRRLDLEDILACPRCRGPVRLSQTEARCHLCRAGYPVYSGIPVLLQETASYPAGPAVTDSTP